METIKNIVFDFGGVLMDWNPRYLYRSYFKDEEEMEYFLTHVCDNDWNREQDRGRPFAEGIRLLVEQYPRYEEAIRLYGQRWGEMLKGEIPEGVALLRRVKAAGYRVYGLTNWSAETMPIAYERYGFLRLLDGVVVSGEEKVIKPAPRIYRILLDRYGLKAEESVFIDDSPANVEAARQLGFRGIVFDDAGRASAQLSALTNV